MSLQVLMNIRAQPGKSLLAGFVLLVTTPVAAFLLVISILGLPIGLALGAIYAMALVGGLLATAFFLGDAEARLFGSGPTVTRGQHALLLLAGVLTLALLRSLLGGVIVLAGVMFGLGALMLAAYQAYSRRAAPASAWSRTGGRMMRMPDRPSGARLAAALALLAGIVATIPASGVATAGRTATPGSRVGDWRGDVDHLYRIIGKVRFGTYRAPRAPAQAS